MTFDWDPAKSDQNFARRGFDFAYYGEHRVIALGLADGIPLTVVFTDRVVADGTIVRRVISARVSSRKERRRYAENLEAIRPQGDPDAGAR